VPAYCFDRHVLVDNTYNYGNLHTDKTAIQVIAGGRTYSFDQAIAQRIIEVWGGVGNPGEPSLVIGFTNLTSGPVLIKVKKGSVFNDAPGRYSNTNSLNILNGIPARKLAATTDVKRQYQTEQNAIWGADVDRARLESLGYSSPRQFQRKFGLTETGTFDQPTKAKLAEQETSLRNRFERVFLQAPRNDTDIQMVSDSIGRLERLYGKPVTGKFTAEVETLLESYTLEHLPKITEYRRHSTSSNSYVFKVESPIGSLDLYTIYTPLGVYKQNISWINENVAALSKSGKEVFLDLSFPSFEKAEAFRTSLNFESTTFVEGNREAIGRFFSTEAIENSSASPVVRTENGHSSKITYSIVETKAKEKMTVSAKLKVTVTKFISTFKQLANGKKSLPSIVSEARRQSGSVTLDFGEFGKMRLIKLLREKSREIVVE
jgi:hypothetical protein